VVNFASVWRCTKIYYRGNLGSKNRNQLKIFLAWKQNHTWLCVYLIKSLCLRCVIFDSRQREAINLRGKSIGWSCTPVCVGLFCHWTKGIPLSQKEVANTHLRAAALWLLADAEGVNIRDQLTGAPGIKRLTRVHFAYAFFVVRTKNGIAEEPKKRLFCLGCATLSLSRLKSVSTCVEFHDGVKKRQETCQQLKILSVSSNV
jgi:hypothetical protein